MASDQEKLQLLQKVTEIIVNKEPELLDNFMDDMIAFQADRNADVRRAVITFFEMTGLVPAFCILATFPYRNCPIFSCGFIFLHLQKKASFVFA